MEQIKVIKHTDADIRCLENVVNYPIGKDQLLKAGFGVDPYNIAIAKSQGKYKGRQPIAIDWAKFGQLYEQWKSGAITAVWFQKEMGLRANTFYRRLKEYERKFT